MKEDPSCLSRLCDELFEREKHYFNPQKISKIQVTNAIRVMMMGVIGDGIDAEAAQLGVCWVE